MDCHRSLMPTPDDVRRLALALPEAHEDTQARLIKCLQSLTNHRDLSAFSPSTEAVCAARLPLAS